MPEEVWTSWLSGTDRIEVRLRTEKRSVLTFSVQFVAQIDDEWHPIVRYDTAHGRPHMDRLWPGGRESDIEKLSGFQTLPVNWGINDKSKEEFFGFTEELTKG